jgi:hypothetical protein
MSWYDRAMKAFDQEYEDGLITSKEYRAAMRDLNSEYEQAAQDAAQEAYDEYY